MQNICILMGKMKRRWMKWKWVGIVVLTVEYVIQLAHHLSYYLPVQCQYLWALQYCCQLETLGWQWHWKIAVMHGMHECHEHGLASKWPYGCSEKTPSSWRALHLHASVCHRVSTTPDSDKGMLHTLTYSIQVLSVVISIFKPFVSSQLNPDRFLRCETTWYVDWSYWKMA